jgi:predicted ATP-grasp superfamily ATP-dependent carboligase
MSKPRAGSSERSAVPVIVLGTGLTALGVQRSLGATGIKTLLVDDTKDMARRSRWARKSVIEHPESPDPESLEALLRRLPVERAVLMACSDNWASAVSSLPDDTNEQFATSMPSQHAVALLADKARLAGALQRLDVAHPWTRVLSTDHDLDDVPEERWPGIFLKPVDSQSFCQLFGVKAFSVTDRADASKRLQQMHDAGLGAIAQEYVPGPPDLHYFVDGFVDRSGRVRALFSRRRTRMFPTDYGNSTFMQTVPLDVVSDAVGGLERLLEDVSYRGIFSTEFKLDPRDGRFRLLEVNVRPWWYVEFATRCGINVCELAYLDALGLSVPERVAFPVGARCRLMPDDFQAYRHLRRSGDLTFRTWSAEVWGATDAIFRWDDPLPAFEPILSLPPRVVRKVRKTLARAGQTG